MDKESQNRIYILTDRLKNATVHMRDYDLDGLTFSYQLNAEGLYNYLVKLIKEVDGLSKDEFNSVMTNLITEFKNIRDNNLGKYETREDYNALICFLVNDFNYDDIEIS